LKTYPDRWLRRDKNMSSDTHAAAIGDEWLKADG
jgi:hypothetical protein